MSVTDTTIYSVVGYMTYDVVTYDAQWHVYIHLCSLRV
jgi:hypothetical protein